MRRNADIFTRANIKASAKDEALLDTLVARVKTDITYSGYKNVAVYAIVERNIVLLDALLRYKRVTLSTPLSINHAGKLSAVCNYRQKMPLQYAVIEFGTLPMLDMLVVSHDLKWAPARRHPERFVMRDDNHICYALSSGMANNRLHKLLRAVKRHPLDIESYKPSEIEKVDLVAVSEDVLLPVTSLLTVLQSPLGRLIDTECSEVDWESVCSYTLEAHFDAFYRRQSVKKDVNGRKPSGRKETRLPVELREADVIREVVAYWINNEVCQHPSMPDDDIFETYRAIINDISHVISPLTHKDIFTILADIDAFGGLAAASELNHFKHQILRGLVDDARRLMMAATCKNDMRMVLSLCNVTPMEAIKEYRLSKLRQSYCLSLLAG